MSSYPPTTPRLTIGIDARAAAEVRAGRGRVVRDLLEALARREDDHSYVCYAREAWRGHLDERFRWVSIASPDPLWHARVAAAASRRCDVFLSSNSYLTVLLLRIPSVAIVYDMVAFDPETKPNRRSVIVERLTLRPGIRRATALWCISEATARALLARHPGQAAKVHVIPLAVSPELQNARPPDPESLPSGDFVLAVGTLEPRKNLPRLVAGYAALRPDLQAEHPLVVVGARGWRAGTTMEALQSLGDRCLLLGHVSDAELVELYRRCAVFCYPSLSEGFGLPVLEAMSFGAPVITSNTSSLPEVGGDAVEYVDPRSEPSITTALEKLLSSSQQRARLSELARARATEFSWDETAAKLILLLEGSANRSR